MSSSAQDVIYCPLCDVPHRMAAVVCDGCGQALHEPVDLDALRDERDERKKNIVFALVGIVGMLVLNIAFFGGAAFIITTAPLGWLIWSWIRFRALCQRLARASSSQPRA